MSPELVQEKPYDHNSDLWFVVPHNTSWFNKCMSLNCKGWSCLTLCIMLRGYLAISRFSLKLGSNNKNLGILDKQCNKNCIAIEVYCLENEITILQYLN